MTIQYDPQKVTDWVTPLEKVYARQSQQLDRYHAQLRERDRQEEVATLNVPEMFAKLASFSSSIKQVVDARETNISSKVKSLYDSADVDQKKIIDQLVQERELDKSHTAFVQRVNATNLPAKYKQLLTSRNGGNVVRVRKLQGYEAVENFPIWIQNQIDENTDGANEDFDRYKDDPIQLKTWYKNKLHKRLGKGGLGFTDAFIATHFQPEMERLASTKGSISGLKSKNVVFAIEGEANAKLVNASIYGFNAGQSNAVAQGAHTLILEGVNKSEGIDLTKSTENTALFYYRLAKDGRFSNEALAALKTGEIEGHPSGKHGDILFSEDQFKKIQQGINEYNTNYLAAHATKNTQSLLDFTANYIQGGETEDAKALALHTFVSNGGDPNSKEYKRLENSDPFANTAESYQNENQYWERAAIDGKLLSKENLALAKEIKNNSLSIEIQKKQEALQKSYNNNGFDTYEKRHKANGNLIMKTAKNRSLGDNEVLEGFNERLQDEITNLEGKLYSIFYNENPNDLQIADKVAIEKKRILTEKGFYAQPGSDQEGVYTKDIDGNFTNYKNSIIGQVETFNKANNIRNRTNWSNQISRSWESAKHNLVPGDTLKERVLNTVNAVLSPQDIIGAFENNKISEELIYKASLFPNTNETELLIAATKALIASDEKEHQTIVKAFKLEEKLKKLPTAQIDLKEKVEALQDKDYSFILDQGLDNITPKQRLRLYTKLQIIADESNEETAAMRSN
jgi:hypothetical protein